MFFVLATDCLICFGAIFVSSTNSGNICKCCLFVVIVGFCFCRCIVTFEYISIWNVGCLILVWPRGMPYIERIAVVACGPVLVFVHVCGRVECVVLFVVRRGCVRRLCICVHGSSLMVSLGPSCHCQVRF